MNHSPSIRGSVYLVTLITVAAIATMVLIGINLRSTTSSKSVLIEQMAEANNAILDATEYALQVISNDPAWNAAAQSGTVFPQLKIGNQVYTGTVTDTDTAALPTNRTTNYRLKLSATKDTTTSTATIDIVRTAAQTIDYITFIKDRQAKMYWKLNEPSGSSTAVDVLNSSHATYLDPSISGTGTNDQGANVPVFNGYSDRLEVPYDSTFSKSSGTYTLWMNSSGTTAFETHGILGMEYKANGVPTLYLVLNNNSLYGFVNDSGSFSLTQDVGPTPSITPGKWHHIALSWGENGLIIYIDGVEAAKNTLNTSGTYTAAPDRGGEQPLKIGAANIWLFSNMPVGFKGSLAHVVYHEGHQLTPTEIEELASIHPDGGESKLNIVSDSWSVVYE